MDSDVCRKLIICNCYISVDDDGICLKGGKGPDAQSLPENGPIEDVLVENCTFVEVHAALTCGSECIHANHITMRNCRVDNDWPIFLFQMRPDTYQIYENITVENITGRCGTIVILSLWTQFFTLDGSTKNPFGIIRNVTIANVKVSCKQFAVLAGNPTDKVENIVFKHVTATAGKAAFLKQYPAVKFEDVILNGTPLKVTQQVQQALAVPFLEPD